ncbi:PEP-CTERM sorting domain-containing protein [Akkermansiaceae bacterium]|nr:PEP-CTERM sorting domain-containing protein [Akkermansiaceae bacterium]
MIHTIKLIRTLFISLLAIGSLAVKAEAAIIMTLTDNGTDLTMRATGTYDLSGTEVSTRFEPDYPSAFASPFSLEGIYGWGVGQDVLSYRVDSTGAFTDNSGGATVPLPTSVSTTMPFYFQTQSADGAVIRFAVGTPNNGTVNETAVWENTTLDDLGMVPGETITVSWPGDSATIQTVAVPEPSAALLLGIGALSIAAHRRRNR